MTGHESMTQPFVQTRYLSTANIAARLNITTRSVRLWAECGEIPAVKFGRQWRFEQRAFEEWVVARTDWRAAATLADQRSIAAGNAGQLRPHFLRPGDPSPGH